MTDGYTNPLQASAGPSQTASSRSRGGVPPDRRGSDNAPEEPFDTDVTTDCDQIIENYRGGKIRKTDAILALVNAIPGNIDENPPSKSAFISYYQMLEAIDIYRRGHEANIAGAGLPITEQSGQVVDEEDQDNDAPQTNRQARTEK